MESIEKLVTYLETVNKITLLSELGNYPEERKNFRLDLEKFRFGVYLWCEELYPNISKILKSLNWLPSIFKIKNPKEIINEYFQLIESAQNNNPTLIQEEINETKQKFFDSTINPIYILIKKYNLEQQIYDETIELVALFLSYLPLLKEAIEKFTKIMRRQAATLKVKSQRMKKSSKIRKTTKILNKIKKEFEETVSPETFKKAEEITDLGKKILNDLNKTTYFPEKVIYRKLNLIKDLDAFNIDFVKYICRLNFILKNGTREYPNNIKIDYTHSKRSKLQTLLKSEISLHYPLLSDFLCKFLILLVNSRNIEAHSTPDNFKFSKNGKFVSIPIKGTNKYFIWKLSTIKKIILTYQAFVDSLGIYYD